MNPNYYQILGIPADADLATIKKAYRARAKQYHPDLNPNDERAAKRFAVLHTIYLTLSDAESRRQYDATLIGSPKAERKQSTKGTNDNGPRGSNGTQADENEWAWVAEAEENRRRSPQNKPVAANRFYQCIGFGFWLFRIVTFVGIAVIAYKYVEAHRLIGNSAGEQQVSDITAGDQQLAERPHEPQPESFATDALQPPAIDAGNATPVQEALAPQKKKLVVTLNTSRPGSFSDGRTITEEHYDRLVAASTRVANADGAALEFEALTIGVDYVFDAPKGFYPLVIRVTRSNDDNPPAFEITDAGVRLFGLKLSVRTYDNPDGRRPEMRIAPGGVFIGFCKK
jgi:hypothetical protein